jgi:energy-coupling factor transporter ATP-binding protein EcfA2
MTEKLGKFLLKGKFCLLYGHRQSGKSTTAYAIKGWLEENSDKEIYIISFSSGIVTGEGLSTFWHSVCSKMASLDANKFKFNINDTASSSTFEGFFSKYNYPSAKDCIIIIDEASYLGNRVGSSNSKVISSFISSLRNLKDGHGDLYNMYSFLLVGKDVSAIP